MTRQPAKSRTPSRTPLSSKNFLIFTVCLAMVCFFWNWRYLRTLNLGTFDWQKEIFFFTFLKDSLFSRGEIPLSIPFVPQNISSYPTLAASSSYWANPEVFTFSPFLLLLGIFSEPQFIKILTLIFSLLGCFGSFFLGIRLGLSLPFGLIFSILTALNPWVMQHQSVGYTPFLNALLCPWILFFLLDPMKRSASLVGASFLSALILYQGGLHVFVWLFLTLGIFLFFSFLTHQKGSQSRIAFFAFYSLMSLTLGLPKLFAILTSLDGFRRPINNSYSNMRELLGLLTNQTRNPYDPAIMYTSYNGVALYDGLTFVGLGFLILFCLSCINLMITFYRRRATENPAFLSLLVGFSWIYLAKHKVWANLAHFIPMLDCEIYPYRFLFLAVLCFTFTLVFEANRISTTVRGPWKMVPWIVFLPVIFSYYNRNEFFSKAATQIDPFPLIKTYREFLEKDTTRIIFQDKTGNLNPKAIGVQIHTGPNLIQIQAPSLKNNIHRVCLEDFRHFRNRDFILHPDTKLIASSDPYSNSTCFEPTSPGKLYLEIKARDYHLTPLSLLSALLFVVMLMLWRSRERWSLLFMQSGLSVVKKSRRQN